MTKSNPLDSLFREMSETAVRIGYEVTFTGRGDSYDTGSFLLQNPEGKETIHFLLHTDHSTTDLWEKDEEGIWVHILTFSGSVSSLVILAVLLRHKLFV